MRRHFVFIIMSAIIILTLISCLIKKKSPEYYFEQGKIECAKTNTYVGIKLLTRAIKLKPHYIEAYMERARAYQSVDSIEREISDYDTLLVWNRNSQEQCGKLYWLIANAYYLKGEDNLACENWRRSRDLNNIAAWDKIRKYCK